MSGTFRNRYKIRACRLPVWDYGRPGAYYITICTRGREPFFGHIDQKRMQLSEAGQLAYTLWSSIPQYFPGIFLDEYVIMPDHIHGILFLTDPPENLDLNDQEKLITRREVKNISPCRITRKDPRLRFRKRARHGAGLIVETRLIASLQSTHRNSNNRIASPQKPTPPQQRGGFAGHKNPMFYQNISRVIRWYKGRVCFEIRKHYPSFSWQSRFYDRIVRDQTELDRIRTYIRQNPMKA